MSDECCAVPCAGSSVGESLVAQARPKREKPPCPRCGQAGKPVEGQTVRALVALSLRRVPQGTYLFCRTRDCPVVYFSQDGETVVLKSEIRERVYQKEPESPDVWICYCFRHSVGDVTEAGKEGRDRILSDINAGIKAEECACDLRNPQGSCCLGNVVALIGRVKSAEAPDSSSA